MTSRVHVLQGASPVFVTPGHYLCCVVPEGTLCSADGALEMGWRVATGPGARPSVFWVERSDRRRAEQRGTGRAVISVPRSRAPQLHNRHAETHRSFACPHVCDFHLSSPPPSLVFSASRVFLSALQTSSNEPESTIYPKGEEEKRTPLLFFLHDNALFFNFFFPLSSVSESHLPI